MTSQKSPITLNTNIFLKTVLFFLALFIKPQISVVKISGRHRLKDLKFNLSSIFVAWDCCFNFHYHKYHNQLHIFFRSSNLLKRKFLKLISKTTPHNALRFMGSLPKVLFFNKAKVPKKQDLILHLNLASLVVYFCNFQDYYTIQTLTKQQKIIAFNCIEMNPK